MVKKVSQVRYDLPVSHTREIGRIVLAWSFIEHLLQTTIWELMDVDAAFGRLAVREPRAGDRVTLLNDLALLRSITIPAKEFKALRKQVEDCARARNLLAHGAWTCDPEKGWMVILAQGSYDFEPEQHSRNRRVAPEALVASAETLATIRGQFDKVIQSVRNLRTFLSEQPFASAGKSL